MGVYAPCTPSDEVNNNVASVWAGQSWDGRTDVALHNAQHSVT